MTSHPLWQCPECGSDLCTEDADVECPHCGAFLNVSELLTTDANRTDEIEDEYNLDVDDDEADDDD